jgi:hypothetical protein
MQAAHTYTTPYYPIYDLSASVYLIKDVPNRTSVLSSSDTIYISSQLNSGVSAIGSFAVSLFKHNKTHEYGYKKNGINYCVQLYRRYYTPN